MSLGWERWVGDEGAIIGLDHFGASAPAGTIFEHFGFTADRVTDVARKVARDGLRGRIPTLDGGPFRRPPDDRRRRGRRDPIGRLGPGPLLSTRRPTDGGRGSYPSAMRIAFAADHAGAVLKDELIRRLAATDAGHELIDLGGDGSDPDDDYPDFAAAPR